MGRWGSKDSKMRFKASGEFGVEAEGMRYKWGGAGRTACMSFRTSGEVGEYRQQA